MYLTTKPELLDVGIKIIRNDTVPTLGPKNKLIELGEVRVKDIIRGSDNRTIHSVLFRSEPGEIGGDLSDTLTHAESHQKKAYRKRGNMEQREKVVSKFYRLKMSGELRTMIESLPVRGLVEIIKGNHVYLGNGTLLIGAREHPTRILIQEDNGSINFEIEAPTAGLLIQCPFNSEEERAKIPDKVTKAIQLCAN